MKKYKSEGIKERTKLIYELGLENEYFNITTHSPISKMTRIDKCYGLLQFIESNNKNPSQKALDPYERTLGRWLSDMKQRVKNIGYIPYNDVKHIIESSKYPDVFTLFDKEEYAMKQLIAVIKFIEMNGKEPSQHSKNKTEQKLGRWLADIRRISPNRKLRTVYASLKEYINKKGYNNLFEPINPEEYALKQFDEVIQFFINFKTLPSKRSTNIHEKNLGHWILGIRRASRGLGHYKLYDSLKQKIENSILPNMFNSNWKDDLK